MEKELSGKIGPREVRSEIRLSRGALAIMGITGIWPKIYNINIYHVPKTSNTFKFFGQKYKKKYVVFLLEFLHGIYPPIS